jgi:hypothetical protein
MSMMMIALRASKMKSATSFICIPSMDNDVPVRFCGNCPIESVRYGVDGTVKVGPVHRDIALGAALDCGRGREAELVITGYIS